MKNFLIKFGSFLKKWYVVLVLLAIYVPLVLIILISFNGETSRGNIKLNFDVPTFVNYINLFQNDQFINALLNSLLLGVIVTPFSLLFGWTMPYRWHLQLPREERCPKHRLSRLLLSSLQRNTCSFHLQGLIPDK